jgi:hypothetical protein
MSTTPEMACECAEKLAAVPGVSGSGGWIWCAPEFDDFTYFFDDPEETAKIGKWLLFPTCQEAATSFAKLATSLSFPVAIPPEDEDDEPIEECLWMTKISPTKNPQSHTHVISVYNKDSTDLDAVLITARLLDALRLVPPSGIYYKPDLFTLQKPTTPQTTNSIYHWSPKTRRLSLRPGVESLPRAWQERIKRNYDSLHSLIATLQPPA